MRILLVEDHSSLAEALIAALGRAGFTVDHASQLAQARSFLEHAEVQRGSMVTVTGKIERILDKDEFRLADDTGTIRVYVGPNWVPTQQGDSITVQGFVDDGIGPLDLYARVMTLPNGSKVEFSHRYD